jgi:hypothetical protein
MEWREVMKIDERAFFEAMLCLLARAVHYMLAFIVASCWSRCQLFEILNVSKVYAKNGYNLKKMALI